MTGAKPRLAEWLPHGFLSVTPKASKTESLDCQDRISLGMSTGSIEKDYPPNLESIILTEKDSCFVSFPDALSSYMT